jgi:rubrerythrin
MLAVAQAVEHYEISRYGTLAAWAEKLELSDAAELLHETLKEEKATDEALTGLPTPKSISKRSRVKRGRGGRAAKAPGREPTLGRRSCGAGRCGCSA